MHSGAARLRSNCGREKGRRPKFFWELLFNYTERLRAKEKPGRWGDTEPNNKCGALAIPNTKRTSEFNGEIKLRCALLKECLGWDQKPGSV
ncbi:hypothetical protein NDU88_000048 [Pleurodeles waltl]|uniref:Uncharacterized protein n=1 Tax=Pleurodeles waltl TaxID=8319 RepID=A0AAV7U390_PLEWA|nr:hypothetical protein NDU88_000048 [Pleurodeles waltl]